MGGGIRQLVQALYFADQDEERWLTRVATAAERWMGDGRGSIACVFDARDRARVRPTAVGAVGLPVRDAHHHIAKAFDGLSQAYVDTMLGSSRFSAMSLSGGDAERGLQMWTERFEVRDILTLIANDASGFGVVVASNRACRVELRRQTRTTLDLLAAHAMSAFHLRGLDEGASDAVLSSGGRILEATRALDADRARAQVVTAARALEALGRHDGARSLARYTPRIEARWSVVSRFTRSGEEYIVAKRNTPPAVTIDALTVRERQVVSYLALGRTPKVVAYELGISASTVRVLLSRAKKKLAARSNRELVNRVRTLSAGADGA